MLLNELSVQAESESSRFTAVRYWHEKALSQFSDLVALSFWKACVGELTALKPGNVHCYAEGHDLTVQQFIESAYTVAPIIAEPNLNLGQRILLSVRATNEAVSTNTNLGIVLLCAPLAQAYLHPSSNSLRESVQKTISTSDTNEAEMILQSIRIAEPAGLGKIELHDVNKPASTNIGSIMKIAEDWDLIARQYATGFSEVFEIGCPTYQSSLNRFENQEEAVTAVFLHFLANSLDSHIVRQHGTQTATQVMNTAEILCSKFMNPIVEKYKMQNELLHVDKMWKNKNINPGTCADLSVATLFAFNLENEVN